MSLQTDLHQAVAQVTADSALLHTIVHGTAAQTVTTEGGAVATVAKLLADEGLNVIGLPKTIDNDLGATDVTFGFYSAVSIVSESLDRLETTANAHQRMMVVEVMGRHAGWIALEGGIAGSADVILLPEIPFSLENVVECIKARKAAGQQAVPFGGAYSPTQVGKRPQDLLASGPERVIEAAMDEVQEIAHG